MADQTDSLDIYRHKRDFTRTQEPEGVVGKRKGFHYLIQKHAATRLHYDFRLELDGVLKSWAVTRGPSLNPDDKRLAVEVEDHPVRYGSFEGTIPKGEYGGGTVMLWDEGSWEPIGDPHEGLKNGDLKFILHGKRLSGSWALVRMKSREQDRGRNNWLLIKHRDDIAQDHDAESWLDDNASSIASGRTMDEIAADPGKVWKAGKAQKADKPKADKAEPKKKAENRRPVRAHTLPLPDFIPPELATLSDDVPEGDDWVHEVKFDGYRIQALIHDGHARMMTRTGLDWTVKFAGIADLVAHLPAQQAILDGEIVALNDDGASSFKTLQDDLSHGRDDRFQYYVFDLLRLDGEDLTRLPLVERKRRLQSLLEGHDLNGRVVFSDHFAHDDGFIGKVCRLGMEGIISKRGDSPYRSGRNKSWLKIKCHKRQEFVIGGFSEPTHAARGIGALMLGYYEEEKFIYAGKCGTGFNGETSVALRKQLDALTRKTSAFETVPGEIKREAIWVKPEVVCEIEFTEWTPDGRLRHPSFQGLREDKPAADIGRDQAIPVKHAEKEAAMEVKAEPIVTPRSVARQSAKDVEVGGIRISHPDRIIYPGTGITKKDLADYYLTVADHLLPFVAGRPLSMVRCPEGLDSPCFFQRHIARDQSPHLFDTGIPVKDRHEDYLMIKDEKGLLTLVQWGVIELHPWGCLADKPDLPDRLIFDLDPDTDVKWADVIAGTHEVRSRMEELGLQSFIKTTGGKGLHVTVPIERKYGWPTIKAFARAIAESMETDAPDRYIAHASKAARKGKIFVDYLRNDLTSTAVSAFSLRARPGAAVSTLLDWSEATQALKPSEFNIHTVPERLTRQKQDPWAGFHTVHQQIKAEYLKALKIPLV